MDIETFRDYCLSLPGSSEKMPFDKFFHGKHAFLAFYAAGRMFCYFDIDAFDCCNIRCRPEQIGELEARYMAVERPYNLSPEHWISVRFDGDVPDEELKRLVRQSYEIALDLRPAKARSHPKKE